MPIDDVVRLVNTQARSWLGCLTDPARSTVFSPVGVWPLLAALAAGARGAARAELVDALGLSTMPAEAPAHILQMTRDLLGQLDNIDGLKAALGLWMAPPIDIHRDWADGLPPRTAESFSGDPEADKARLDEWARANTDGLIPHMPLDLGGEPLLLVLASALALRTTWLRPFDEAPNRELRSGPWKGRMVTELNSSGHTVNDVAVLRARSGEVTEVRVYGEEGIDVHLLLGAPDAAPAGVLAMGIDALTLAAPTELTTLSAWGAASRMEASPGSRGPSHPRKPAPVDAERPRVERTPGSALPDGTIAPGLKVTMGKSHYSCDPVLTVSTVPFEVRAEHDLLTRAVYFGLESATNRDIAHFPGISDTPLAVSQAKQSALASFHSQGFEAAAVTAIGMVRAGAAAEPPKTVYTFQRINVDIDRPFGFLAVHRATGLVLFGGWVTEPAE